jgi:colanic acid/amylovoran biosynthesis glycosyltransferase
MISEIAGCIHSEAASSSPAVAHVVGCYLAGSENWIHTQILHLREHEPFVLAGKTKNLEEFDWIPPVYAISDRSLPVRLLAKLGNRTLSYNPLFRYQLHQRNAKLMHAHFGPTGYRMLPLAAASGLPLVTTFYGYDLSLLPQVEPEWHHRYETLFNEGSHFFVEGSHMKQKLIDLGCPSHKVTVHHLGVKTSTLPYKPRLRTKGAPLRVLMAGRYTEKKGFPYAVDAFAQFLNSGGHGRLTLIGGSRDEHTERSFRASLAEQVARHGIEDAVHFRGFLPHDQLIQAYLDHHVLLSPSVEAEDGDTEGGAPITLIEASATGMPVVSSMHCDIPEVVIDGETGLLVEERDIQGLAASLMSLYTDRRRLRSMGCIAREHIKKEYDAEQQGMRMDQLYNSLRNT